MNFYITSENAELELNRLYDIRNRLNEQVLLCETLDKPTWVSIYNDRLVNVNENIKQVVNFIDEFLSTTLWTDSPGDDFKPTNHTH